MSESVVVGGGVWSWKNDHSALFSVVGRGREISEEHDGDGRVGERRRGKGFRGKVQPKKRRARPGARDRAS